jgi:tripartite-type tricarboxylate transporter receptor subunit TctC
MQWYRRIQFRSFAAAALAALALVGLFASCASAQGTRSIRLILPFPPGGPADAMARIVAQQIGASGGPTMVVESHPGAGTEIGTEYVAQAAPDGNTLLIISPSFVVLPHVRKLHYDPLEDFVPVCELATFPPLIVVNADSPYHTLADFIDAAHARPGALTYGTIGPATASQIAFEMLAQAAKADITFVPFTGYTPAVQALLAHQVNAAQADLTTLQGQLQTGKLRALATTAAKRVSMLPNVPTVIESGYKNVEAEFYGAAVAPAKTPKATVNQLIKLFSDAIKAPQVRAKFATLGLVPGGQCGADFSAILHQDYDNYGRTIRQAHLQIQ